MFSYTWVDEDVTDYQVTATPPNTSPVCESRREYGFGHDVGIATLEKKMGKLGTRENHQDMSTALQRCEQRRRFPVITASYPSVIDNKIVWICCYAGGFF
jgi:hypothetical protein